MMRKKAFIRLTLRKLKRLRRYLWVNLKVFKRKQKLNWRYKKRKIIIKYSIITVLSLLAILSIRNKIQIVDNSTHTKEVIFADTTNTLESFLYQLRYIESRDNHLARRYKYAVIRTSHGLDTVKAYSQYIGFYQMGYSARQSASTICPSLKNIDNNEYWNSQFYQHKSVICWLLWLRQYLNDEINLYNNKFYGSFYITESGIIGMSHLVGPNAFKNWIKSGDYSLHKTYRIVDGNGKKGTDYLQQLGRYELRLNRFINEKGKVNESQINKFVNSIIENKTVIDNIIDDIKPEEKYIIIDSIEFVKDSINYRLNF